MKNFIRNYPLFSLCDLNCGLCPMHLDNYFFCIAVNLLEFHDVKSVMEQIAIETK